MERPSRYGGEERDCPEIAGREGRACDGRSLWGIIGLVTLTSPVLIAFFYSWLKTSGDPEEGARGDDDGFGFDDGGGGGRSDYPRGLYAYKYQDLDAVGAVDDDEDEDEDEDDDETTLELAPMTTLSPERR